MTSALFFLSCLIILTELTTAKCPPGFAHYPPEENPKVCFYIDDRHDAALDNPKEREERAKKLCVKREGRLVTLDQFEQFVVKGKKGLPKDLFSKINWKEYPPYICVRGKTVWKNSSSFINLRTTIVLLAFIL